MGTTATFERSSAGDMNFVPGQSAPVLALNVLIAQIAGTDIPVLLVGESGTGKEIYARLIHQRSENSEAELRKVNCASPGAAMLLGEVLRDVQSQTEETRTRCGTLFLDGIHELDAAGQKLLLSLLPDGDAEDRSGLKKPRIISSTSRNLEQAISAGRFLRELYFRINGATLRLPALRERREDVPALLQSFFLKHSKVLHKNIPELSREAQDLIDSYDWPGNIRELENAAKKIIAVGDAALALADLQGAQRSARVSEESERLSSLKAVSRAASRQAERELIQKALERTHWNRKRAAQDLQVSYKSLLYKIKLAGLDAKKPEQE